VCILGSTYVVLLHDHQVVQERPQIHSSHYHDVLCCVPRQSRRIFGHGTLRLRIQHATQRFYRDFYRHLLVRLEHLQQNPPTVRMEMCSIRSSGRPSHVTGNNGQTSVFLDVRLSLFVAPVDSPTHLLVLQFRNRRLQILAQVGAAN
jgi:hypothetical protein